MNARPFRRPNALFAAVLGLLAAGATVTGQAAPTSVIGATLRANNPDGPAVVEVQATFLGDAQSLYTNELYLDAPNFLGPIFESKSTPVNTTASLGTFLPETVLFIRNQAYYIPSPGSPASYNFGFFTGTGLLPLNPDSLPHAIFTFDPDVPDGSVTVSFEDQFGGGDLDFNDAVYSFTNVRAGFVDTALIPNLNPIGNTVTVDDTEERFAAGLDDSFSNLGTIDNGGRVFNYGDFINAGSFTNLNALFNDMTGSLVNAAGGTLDNQGDLGNFGAMQNAAGATIDNSGTMLVAGDFESTGDVQNAGQIVFRSMSAANQSIAGMIGNLVDGLITNESSIRIGGSLSNDGDVVNVGEIVFDSMSQVDQSINGMIENLGTLVSKDLSVMVNGGTVQNGGVVVLEGGAEIRQEAGGVIQNSGQWVIDPGASVTGSGDYVQADAAGETIVNGDLEAATIQILDGVLSGAGFIKGQVGIGLNALLAPGESPGTLHIEGDVTLDGGKLAIELADLLLYDLIEISGEAIFAGGTVEYDFGFTPVAGDSFVFLTAEGGITGVDTLAFSFIGAAEDLDFVTELVGNSLVLTAVPLPATAWLAIPVLLSLAGRIRRRGSGTSISESPGR